MTNSFAIWGDADFADALGVYLRGSGLNCSQHKGSQLPSDRRASLVIAEAAMDRGTPRFDAEWRRRFVATAADLRNRGWDGPLVHPVAAIDAAAPHLPDRYYFFGIQGSGNSIYQTLVNEIIKIKQSNTTPKLLESWARAAQLDYGELIVTHIADVIDTLVRARPYVPLICNGIPFGQVQSDLGSEGILCIFNISLRQLFVDNVCGQHAPLFAGNLDYLKIRGIRPVFCKRNPLDTFASGIRKLHQAGRTEIDPIEYSYALRRLANFDYILQDEVSVCYEDLMSEPRLSITNLAKMIGVDLSAATIEQLWSKFGARQLDHASEGHFTGGLINAWRDWIPASGLELMRDCGYGELMRRLGYAVPAEVNGLERTLDVTPWDVWPISDPGTVSAVVLDRNFKPATTDLTERFVTTSGPWGGDLFAAGRVDGKVRLVACD